MPRIIVDVPDVELTVEALRSDADRRQRAGLKASAELVASGQKDIRTDAAKVVRVLGEATLLGNTAGAIETAFAVPGAEELQVAVIQAVEGALDDDVTEKFPSLADKLIAAVADLLADFDLDVQEPPAKPARRRNRKAKAAPQPEEPGMPPDPDETGPRNPVAEAVTAAMGALDAMDGGPDPDDEEDDETGALPEDEPAGTVPDVLADPPAAG